MTDLRSRASDMIERNGQTVTITYVGTSVYDPATGTTTNTAPDPQTVPGILFPVSMTAQRFQKDGSSLVVAGDQQLLLSALNTDGAQITAPQVNGTITDSNDNVWTVVIADPLSPAGMDLIYDCIVRRAA
jgi:hypothetical protein